MSGSGTGKHADINGTTLRNGLTETRMKRVLARNKRAY